MSIPPYHVEKQPFQCARNSESDLTSSSYFCLCTPLTPCAARARSRPASALRAMAAPPPAYHIRHAQPPKAAKDPGTAPHARTQGGRCQTADFVRPLLCCRLRCVCRSSRFSFLALVLRAPIRCGPLSRLGLDLRQSRCRSVAFMRLGAVTTRRGSEWGVPGRDGTSYALARSGLSCSDRDSSFLAVFT